MIAFRKTKSFTLTPSLGNISIVVKEVGVQLSVWKVKPSELDRDTYVLPRIDHDKCIGCGRCYTSCYDGGHQAIKFNADTRRASLIGPRCVGCHLCLLVCPVGAITAGKRIPKNKR